MPSIANALLVVQILRDNCKLWDEHSIKALADAGPADLASDFISRTWLWLGRAPLDFYRTTILPIWTRPPYIDLELFCQVVFLCLPQGEWHTDPMVNIRLSCARRFMEVYLGTFPRPTTVQKRA